MNIKKMYILTLCALGVTSLNVEAAQSYSCGAVYPDEVYCPVGKNCSFYAPTCTIDLSNIIGGSSITEELYDLNVPSEKFEKITLIKSDQLPFSQYPKLNQKLVYELTATKGKFPNIPFRIVIQTEVPNNAFISKIERGIKNLKNKEQIDSAKKLVDTLKNLKNNNQGVNAIYRSVPALGEKKYKLYYVRVPGSAPGYIIGRPDGNLEFHERDPKDAKTELITVIDTGVLM